MVLTKKTVSITKFELSEKDKAEIKDNLPRLAKLYTKENKDFVSAIDENMEDFFDELNLNCFNEMVEAYHNYGGEDDVIYDCEGFDDCLRTLETMIKEYINSFGTPVLLEEDFKNEEELEEWIEYKIDSLYRKKSSLYIEELRKKGELKNFMTILSKL